MGGVFETGYDFTRALGGNWNQVQLYAFPPTLIGGAGLQYPSGFSARDPAAGNVNLGALTIAIGGTSTPTPLTWDPAGFFCPNPLILNAATANAPIYFLNSIDLNNMPREVDVDAPTYPAYMKGALTGGGGLVKGGPGTLILGPVVNTYLGDTTVLGGALRANDGTTLPSAGCLTLNNGVWESSTAMVGTGGSLGGQMLIAGGTSGFSNTGKAAVISVAFGTLLQPTSLTWGAAPFQPDALVLNDAAAMNSLDFKNPIDLNGTLRTVIVDLPARAPTIVRATMSGDLSGTTGGLVKTGEGTLVLSGINTYMGGTFVSDGTLIVATSLSLADGSDLTVGDGSLFAAPVVPASVITSAQSATAVPEPGALALLGAALCGAAVYRRLRSRRKKQ